MFQHKIRGVALSKAVSFLLQLVMGEKKVTFLYSILCKSDVLFFMQLLIKGYM